jgi:hypothetical protein
MIKSIIELTDLIQKYKQDIFWESEKLKKKFNSFYKNQSIETLEKLKDYKIFGHIDLNVFLFNRRLLFSDNPRSLDDVLSSIFGSHKKLDREQLRKEILNHIFMVIYNIVESITQIDQLFKIAPKTDKDMIVYRGLNFENRVIEEKMSASLLKLKKGDLYTFPNYMSTSLLNDIALSFLKSKFTNKSNSKPKCCFFKIIIPKNTRILYLDTNIIQNIRIPFVSNERRKREDQLMLNALEYEVLLPRASTLKFIQSHIISGGLPDSCQLSDVKKGKINEIYVYEFEFIEVDKNRESFNLKKMKEAGYIEKLMSDIVNIEFFLTKYDLLYQLKKKNIEAIIRKTKEEQRKKRRHKD